ncbi:hypothetical protein Tco_0041022 [Tanacetum coccineum]
MDSMIPIGQKNTLAEYMILSGADNRPPMLDKDLRPREEEQVILDRSCKDIKARKESHEEAASSQEAILNQKLRTSNKQRTASPNEGLSLSDTKINSQEDDSEIPPLEDIHQILLMRNL